MQRTALLAAFTLALSFPALAADLSVGTELGRTGAEIRANLESQGYSIIKQEMEYGRRMEVYAEKDGTRWEMMLDTDTGRITEIERKSGGMGR